MRKIIGIQTPHYAPNYGAKLQAFALGETLRKEGYDIEYINRRPVDSSFCKNPIVWYGLQWEEKRHLKNFLDFEKEYLQPQSVEMYNNSEFSKIDVSKYYAIVVGSDQMWRDDYFYAGFELTPYLFYTADYDIRRIAYAVSFGKATCVHPAKRLSQIKQLLRNFDAISVREQSGINIMHDVYGLYACWVADPTLLHKRNFYIRHFSLQQSIEEENIITTYILDQSTTFFEKSQEIARKLQMPLKHIIRKKGINLFYKRPFNMLPDLSERIPIREWLDRIKTSKYVVTDSYHGMLFSIIFGKQFIVFNRTEGGSERYISILSRLKMTDRLFSEDSEADDIIAKLREPIDYQKVYRIVDEFADSSLLYLRQALCSK